MGVSSPWSEEQTLSCKQARTDGGFQRTARCHSFHWWHEEGVGSFPWIRNCVGDPRHAAIICVCYVMVRRLRSIGRRGSVEMGSWVGNWPHLGASRMSYVAYLSLEKMIPLRVVSRLLVGLEEQEHFLTYNKGRYHELHGTVAPPSL